MTFIVVYIPTTHLHLYAFGLVIGLLSIKLLVWHFCAFWWFMDNKRLVW